MLNTNTSGGHFVHLSLCFTAYTTQRVFETVCEEVDKTFGFGLFY